MRKLPLTAIIGSLFPAVIGPGNNPNVGLLGAMPDVTSLNAAILNINPFQETNLGTAANTTGFTAGGSQIAGAAQNVLILSGTLGAGAALTLPTVAALLASLTSNVQAAPVGTSWQLRIVVLNAAAFSWTVTTNTGWTLSGAQTLAANSWRDFIVQVTSATTATLTSIGAGTTP